MRKITIFHATQDNVFLAAYFKPSPALTEVTVNGVRRFYNTNGQLIAKDEPAEGASYGD